MSDTDIVCSTLYEVSDKVCVSFHYPTLTLTAENSEGFLDVLLPEGMIMYNNKIISPEGYITANMYVLSQILENNMTKDKSNHKNYNELRMILRKITMGLYNVPDDVVITKRYIF
tara:strand:- start:507 stop:851 length:345 start_codon:yes stop_codon:yes gene_type:complete